ncbi:type II toxin-antitoxin system VapB family antitoxin [Caenispirillum bisanense]|uniref:type II toxin-antitoxin system VapB family antitoxin n=1 Tax=Caenispirillum bisanense TaxID=414052 RepID=UPI0031DDCAFB
MYVRSQRAEDLARKLAERTGKSISQVVEDALDEQWQRVEGEGEREGAGEPAGLDELMVLARDCARHLGDRRLDTDDLYDRDGLPR